MILVFLLQVNEKTPYNIFSHPVYSSVGKRHLSWRSRSQKVFTCERSLTCNVESEKFNNWWWNWLFATGFEKCGKVKCFKSPVIFKKMSLYLTNLMKKQFKHNFQINFIYKLQNNITFFLFSFCWKKQIYWHWRKC